MTVLIVAPHADDEVLGCGGTIARHAESGEKVVVAIMTNASVGAPELFPRSVVDTARREALEAHAVLGVGHTVFFDFPAPRLDQHPQYRISESIAEVIAEYSPTTVYLPHRGDLHRDHAVVYSAALVACRPFINSSVCNIYSYETLSETEWAHPFGDDSFIPTHFVDVSDFFRKKIDAMRCYRSQLKPSPHPRSLDGIHALSRFRGSTVCVEHAEAFMTVRTITRA